MTDQRVNETGEFYYEKIIKSSQYKEGVDYTVDGSLYDILSPQLRREVLLAENPLNSNIDVSELELTIFVDRMNAVSDFPRIQELAEDGREIENVEVSRIEDNKNKNKEVHFSYSSLPVVGKTPTQTDVNNYEAEYHEWMAKAAREKHFGKKMEFQARARTALRHKEAVERMLLEAKQQEPAVPTQRRC